MMASDKDETAAEAQNSESEKKTTKKKKSSASSKKVAKGTKSKGTFQKKARPFPWRTLEEALKIPYAIREKNNGKPWATEDVAQASMGIAKTNNKFYYAASAARDYGLTVGTRDTAKIELADRGREIVFAGDDCLRAGLFDWGGRILALVAPGSGPGRAVVEAHIRQLARDLASAGITANTILTGVMESPALRTSPGYDEFLKQARMRNPHRRLTMPEDVARCIAALCHPATYWMTGNTLHVDGGENIVG